MQLSYDFDGNGVIDRVETYTYFPTNDVAGWEVYDETRGLISAEGLVR